MNILLTGGAGYIGSHAALSLIDKGHSVTIIDNLITGTKRLIPKKAKYHECDIDDIKRVSKIFNNDKFDVVMHFAGLISVDDSVKEPERYRDFNFVNAKAFLESCYENSLKKVKRLISKNKI